jgi:chromatin-remodeling ATPase INO80
MTAQRISHYYSSRIARMPLPPGSLAIQAPRLDDGFREPSPVLEYASEYERSQDDSGVRLVGRFGFGAEDAAHELERSVLEDHYDYPDTRIRQKSNQGKEPSKRPASDSNSDFEVPKKSEKTGPVLKKRKLDKDTERTVDVHEQFNVTDALSSSMASKLKGKDRQIQRETSYDSLSLTPKPLRKKASKKKFGEFELESGSLAPSASADVTPAISRPASPAIASSAFVYELDEQIPPLRKAKKMDDSAIMKRVKALEEAQRKVWTNIARRDIVKV